MPPLTQTFSIYKKNREPVYRPGRFVTIESILRFDGIIRVESPTVGFLGTAPPSPLGAPNFNTYASELPVTSWPPGTNVPPNVIVVKFPNRSRPTYFVERMPFDITMENAASVLEWRCLFQTTTTDGRTFQMISLKQGVTADHPLLKDEITPLVGNFPMLRLYSLNQQRALEAQTRQMLACLSDPIEHLTSNFRSNLSIAVNGALRTYSQRYRATDDAYNDDDLDAASTLLSMVLEPPSPGPAPQPPSPDQAFDYEEFADPDFAAPPPAPPPSSPQQPPIGNATAKGPGGVKVNAQFGHPGDVSYRHLPNLFYNATPAHPHLSGGRSPTYSEASTLDHFDDEIDSDSDSDDDGPHHEYDAHAQRGLMEALSLARRGADRARANKLVETRARKRAAKSAKRRNRRRLEARERKLFREAEMHEQAKAQHENIMALFRRQEERNRSKSKKVSFAYPAPVTASTNGNRAPAGKK